MKNSNISISKVSLPQFDFSALESMDPLLCIYSSIIKEEGYIPMFDQEIPFRIQLAETESQTNDFPTAENLRVSILVQGNETTLQ